MGILVAKIVITTLDVISSVVCLAATINEDTTIKRVGIMFLMLFIFNICGQWM